MKSVVHVDCFNGAILIFLQSIDVSVHVTSDQKVCLFCYFNEILLVSSSNFFFSGSFTERSTKVALFVEWFTTAMLPICKKILSSSFG